MFTGLFWFDRESLKGSFAVHLDLENCLKRKKSLNTVEHFKAGFQFFCFHALYVINRFHFVASVSLQAKNYVWGGKGSKNIKDFSPTACDSEQRCSYHILIQSKMKAIYSAFIYRP